MHEAGNKVESNEGWRKNNNVLHDNQLIHF